MKIYFIVAAIVFLHYVIELVTDEDYFKGLTDIVNRSSLAETVFGRIIAATTSVIALLLASLTWPMEIIFWIKNNLIKKEDEEEEDVE